MMKFSWIPVALLAAASVAAADIALPAPETSGGMPLLEALAKRRSERAISNAPLSPAEISNLLWAANGITRKDGRRTAPTAMNRQELSLYVVMPNGAYLHDAKKNVLKEIYSGRCEVANNAPLMIVIVADLGRQKRELAAVDSGFIGQNIYLYCAANNLATVFKASFNASVLKSLLKLEKTQLPMYVQPVGRPAR